MGIRLSDFADDNDRTKRVRLSDNEHTFRQSEEITGSARDTITQSPLPPYSMLPAPPNAQQRLPISRTLLSSTPALSRNGTRPVRQVSNRSDEIDRFVSQLYSGNPPEEESWTDYLASNRSDLAHLNDFLGAVTTPPVYPSNDSTTDISHPTHSNPRQAEQSSNNDDRRSRARGDLARRRSIRPSETGVGVRWAMNLPEDDESESSSDLPPIATTRNRFNRPYIRFSNPQFLTNSPIERYDFRDRRRRRQRRMVVDFAQEHVQSHAMEPTLSTDASDDPNPSLAILSDELRERLSNERRTISTEQEAESAHDFNSAGSLTDSPEQLPTLSSDYRAPTSDAEGRTTRHIYNRYAMGTTLNTTVPSILGTQLTSRSMIPHLPVRHVPSLAANWRCKPGHHPLPPDIHELVLKEAKRKYGKVLSSGVVFDEVKETDNCATTENIESNAND
ncbi:hypothetical protein CANARDRAFT_27968, partial [[Candida] arabinofermentans NRRL YB-2248]